MLKEELHFGYEHKEGSVGNVCLEEGFKEALSKFITGIKEIRPYENTTGYVEVITMNDAFVYHVDQTRYEYNPMRNKFMNHVDMSIEQSLTADLRKRLVKDILMFDFSKALEHLKQGKAVARTGWNGKGLFVYMVSGGTYKVQMDIVKPLADSNNCLTYEPYFAIWNGRGTINTWVPSVSDLLAEDYVVIEDTKEYIENAKNRN